MTRVWKEYVGQLKEKLDMINDTLALTQRTAVARCQTLSRARDYLQSLMRERQSGRISASDIYNTLMLSSEYRDLGIIIANAEGKVTGYNNGARELIGSDLLSVDGDLDQALYLADKVTPCGRNLPWRRAAEGMEVLDSRVFLRRSEVPDGLWLQVDAVPIKDADGMVKSAVAIFVDVTESVQAESYIYDVRRVLEQRLTATASAHDDLTLLAGKLGRKGWDATESPEQMVLVAAQLTGDTKRLALVVDDIQVHHVLLGSYLSSMGFIVHSANNGQEAVDAAKNNAYSVIFMDCDMPVLDGFEATRKIRKAEKLGERVPIIAMTSYDRLGDREKCLAAGMDDYVVKNSDHTGLLRVVESVLKGEPLVPDVEIDIQSGERPSSTPEMDLKALEKMYGKRARKEILPLFIKTTSLLIECLRSVLAERDVRATHHYAYCIKGPAASLGCGKIARHCEALASAALRNKWFDSDLEFDSLESVFDEIARKYEPLLKNIGIASRTDLPSLEGFVEDFSPPPDPHPRIQGGERNRATHGESFPGRYERRARNHEWSY
jgi:CheY-like chemotaxis protein/PAS domain-containing protein/HPt (histidine-containing phosphotransfer) domain-containing protein